MKFKTLKILKENVSLRNVCKSVMKLFERKSMLKKVKLLTNIMFDIPDYIITDKNRIR